jgi:PTS system ascorbate-specific IIA component
MIGILLITHGSLGRSFIECAEHVMGNSIEKIAAIGIDENASIEQMLTIATETIADMDSGEGVLVLTDMYGGSPSNITNKLLGSKNINGASGVNLPMLIRALTYREKDLKTVVQKALSGGGEGVMQIPSK